MQPMTSACSSRLPSRISATTTGSRRTPIGPTATRGTPSSMRAALNHPSVVFYSMSHNATGYDEDMNPKLIDGLHDPRESWAKNNTAPRAPRRSHRSAARPRPDRLSPRLGQPGLDAREQLLSQLRPGARAFRLVRALGHQGREAGLHLRVRRTLHLGLVDVSRLVQGTAFLRQRRAFPGSFAWPSGTPSSWETGPTA